MATSSITRVRVCLIEDNEAYRASVFKVAERVVGPGGVRAFGDCERGLEAFDGGLSPEVILLDIGLPGISGLQGISSIKKILPAACVIMLTNFEDHARVFEAICSGASGYLLKNSPLEDLSSAITQALAGGAPMTHTIARAVLEQFAKLAAPKVDESKLTAREQEVLELMARGRIMKEIASDLQVSYHTVDSHIRNIYTKLHVRTRAGAVAKAYQERLL